MKKKNPLRRCLCLALTGLLSLSVLWPGLTASAQDGLVIDDSGFSTPTRTEMTVYYWHEGLPKVNADTKNRKYPVLLTWDSRYYFSTDNKLNTVIEKNLSDNRKNMVTIGWSTDDDYSGYYNGDFGPDGRFPYGYFYQNLGYGSGLLSELPIMNFDALKQMGTTVSFSSEGLPNLIPLENASMTDAEFEEYSKTVGYPASTSSHVHRYKMTLPCYALEVDRTEDDGVPEVDPVSITTGMTVYTGQGDGEKYLDSGGFRVGDNYLIGMRRDIYQVIQMGKTDVGQYNSFTTTLYPINLDTARLTYFEEFHNATSFDYWGFKEGNYKKSVGWYVYQMDRNGQKIYRFLTPGSWFHDKYSRISHSWLISAVDRLEWYIKTEPSVALAHSGSNFATHGRVNWDDDWLFGNFDRSPSWKMGTLNTASHNFVCYYGEPVLMDFLQTDFSVENGQVSNLDGPIAIANDTTITVKEGGTLSISGWVVNNGHIVVEPGGTLYIQDGACLNRLLDGKHNGGGVLCRGLCIVGENAKLCGGGVEGLQFLAGSHVINFGAIVSENFLVEQDYTVENRSGGTVLYGKGCGVNGSGYALYAGSVIGTNYPEKGAVEPVVDVNVVANGIYSN